MGFFERLSRIFRANLNYLVSAAEDPAKVLDQSVLDMQNDLEKLRQAVASAIASQRRLARQAEQSQHQSRIWYQRAEQAIQQGEEGLAREALVRRKTFQETFSSLSNQLEGQEGQVQMLKRSLVSLEAKIAAVRTKKDMLKARAKAAEAKNQLETAVGKFGFDSAISAFEKMEDKIEDLEAFSDVSAELAGTQLDEKFASFKESEEIDEELRKLRTSLQMSEVQAELPVLEDKPSSNIDSVQGIEVQAIDITDEAEDGDKLQLDDEQEK